MRRISQGAAIPVVKTPAPITLVGVTGKGFEMFLKKVDGPRAVTLPDGSVMTRADLPDKNTRRWVASRKAAVVRAVTHGLITKDEAMESYNLSEEEFAEWENAVAKHGEEALRATALQKYRQP
jgi:hypothetical protein